MKHIHLIFSLGLVFSVFGFTTHATPSTLRKVSAGAFSPFATLGAVSAVGYAADAAVKYGCGITSPARPWLIGAATAYVGYNLFVPATRVFYTLLSGDSEKLIKLVGKTNEDTGIMQKNEETIREILREILYVKNRLVEHFGTQKKNTTNEKDAAELVGAIVEKDLFLKDLPRIIGDTKDSISARTAQSPREVLNYTGRLISKKDMTHDYWWSTSWGQAILSVRNALIRPFTAMRSYSDPLQWNFVQDERLLATLGGSAIEDAARNLIQVLEVIHSNNSQQFLVLSRSEKEKMLERFYTAAETIIKHADTVLKDLKTQRQSMQRVRDIVFLFSNPSSSHDVKDHEERLKNDQEELKNFIFSLGRKGQDKPENFEDRRTSSEDFDEVGDYSMNVLSQIYQ